jgi:YesN/AraC family two-component response regulator
LAVSKNNVQTLCNKLISSRAEKLPLSTVISILEIIVDNGKKDNTYFYKLDTIILVGFRINLLF